VAGVTATWHVGSALSVLRTMEAASVDFVCTSPAYLALRSYLPPDHPAKADEMGSEPTPGAFLDGLLDVVEELRRVLAPHGSLALELGDTYAGSGGGGGDYLEGGFREGQPGWGGTAERAREGNAAHWRQKNQGSVNRRHHGVEGGRVQVGAGWPLDRSLCMVPELLRFALAYGFNPLTGRDTPRWRVRNVVRHFRPNPPVGALGNKFRPATSDWCIAMPGTRRYFDVDSVRTPSDYDRPNLRGLGSRPGGTPPGQRPNGADHTVNPAGAPPLDWWDDDDLEWRDAAGFVAPTAPYPGLHYATFSPKVIRRLIEPMTPRRVCRACGAPSERITRPSDDYQARRSGKDIYAEGGKGSGDRSVGMVGSIRPNGLVSAEYVTTGWTDCGCPADDWRPGVVLDPFAGSGTTLAVATGCGRDAIGIDLNEANLALAQDRIGPLFPLDVIDHRAEAPAS
jgi:hypothetical protein